MTVSDYNLRFLRRTFGRDARSVHRIYNGLALDRLTYRSPDDRPPVVVSVGRLIEKKGFPDLIDACALLKKTGRSFRCLVVGEGELEPDLRARIARLRLADTVELVGPRPQAVEYARDRGVPGLLEVNAPLIEEQARHRDLVDRSGAERVAARVFAAAPALIAVSDGVAAYLEGWREARGRVQVVPNGVDAERFRPDVPPVLPRTPGSFVVGFVGTLKPWHGLATLVEAFARLRRGDPDVRLLVVGDGPERGDLEADLRARGLAGAFHLTGAVDPADVPGLLTAMDVAVAPYPQLPDFYFSPLKVYEYMAAGRAVVASRTGQLADLIQHGVNGLLVPPGDPAALAEVLGQLRLVPAWRARLGETARATVLRGRTWDAVVGRILELAGQTVAAPAVGAAP